MPSAIFGDDTDAETEKILIDLLRKATPQQRLQGCLDMTDFVRRMSRRAIARANPDWDEQRISIEFVRLTYGEDLAQGFQKYLAERIA